MIELKPDNYSNVIPLLNRVPFNNFFARVVVENKVTGRIFVDDDINPTVCLIIHKYGMSLLCGNSENDSFNKKLVSFLKNDDTNNNITKWMLVFPEKWEDKLTFLLGKNLLKATDDMDDATLQKYKKNYIIQTKRVNFKFDASLFSNNIKIPDGLVLKRINHKIFKNISGSVVPQYFWDSAKDFLENGIGFSLMFNDQIVSTCFSAFIVDDKLELGIETNENFRRKGYSIYPATALIEHCLFHGYEPIWACRKENISSFKLAHKLGFLPLSYHPYYSIPTH